uniref:Uncharacterized protein n=1 Tax=Rhizophora mucronata TaxID=61149 RepID=A0A2P2Q114_RHIMU
MDFCVENCEG